MSKTKFAKALIVFFLTIFPFAYLSAEEGHGESEFNLSEILVHHLMDDVIFEFQPGGTKVYEGQEGFEHHSAWREYTFHDERGTYRYEGGLPLHLTKRVVMMFIAAFLLMVVMISAARFIVKNPMRVNGRFAGAIEALVQFVREDVAETNMHHHSRGFQPYILTLFFFILFMNLLGLFPPFGEMAVMAFGHHGGGHEVSPLLAVWPGITVTGDVAVTMTLALFTTGMIWVTGFKYQGFKFLWQVVPNGVPAPLYLLMWPLEFIVGPLAKGFALTVRLMANMTAGHVIILVLLGFIFQFKSLLIAPVSVVGAGAIYMLEIFVAFLQAFIFALLSALFIGSSMHRH